MKQKILNAFAKEVHEKYVKSGLGTKPLAEKCGVSFPIFSYLFTGKRGIQFDTAIKIANALDIDLGLFQKKFRVKNRITKINEKKGADTRGGARLVER